MEEGSPTPSAFSALSRRKRQQPAWACICRARLCAASRAIYVMSQGLKAPRLLWSCRLQKERAPLTTMSKKIQILLVDDHGLFRESLSRLLQTESDFQIVGD